MTNSDFIRHPREVAEAYIASGVWNDDTMWGWLDEWASTTPDQVAVREADGRIHTYRELCDASKRFANKLVEIGLRKGDVVAIQLPSCAEFLIAYFGITRMGGVLATMHMPFRDGELDPLLRFSQARAIICAPPSGKYEGPVMMERLRTAIPALSHIIVARGEARGGDWLDMAEMIDDGSPYPPADPPAASDPALLCFTSGTSSAPKGVMHAYETLAADARAYVAMVGLTSGDRSMVAPPFTHIFGLECVNNAVCSGGTIMPLEHFTSHAYAEMLEKLRPTVVYSAPAHLAATLKERELEGRDLTSIRQVILGGSICPPHLASEFETHLPNGRVGSLFGMTEVLLVTQTPMDGEPGVRHGTVGRPIPGAEVRIVDAEGATITDGSEGELQVRSFTTMAGYMKNEAANAKAFTPDGWFRTGDLAAWDGKGNIVITGRLTDVINRGGVKINPSDIENVICDHEKIVHAALVPIPDDVLGERICAALTLVPGASLDLEELCAFLAERGVAKMRWPERVVIVDEMPMTPTRKISKGALRSKLEEVL
jgi:non-ribosomal peptide synthetase component E (peptide arylation enzyme)